MWITDLQVALNEIFEIYGFYCCIKSIKDNIITMTNDDLWYIKSDGHIEEIEI